MLVFKIVKASVFWYFNVSDSQYGLVPGMAIPPTYLLNLKSLPAFLSAMCGPPRSIHSRTFRVCRLYSVLFSFAIA